MLTNEIYDLMLQLTQEHKSLWRIKNYYLKNAEGDEERVTFWKKLERDKEAHIEELLALLKRHLA